MKRTVHLLLQTLLTCMILLAGGCKFPPRPMQFSNMMARGNSKLAEAAKSFAKAVEPLGKNQRANMDSAQSSYKEIQSVLSELKKEFDTLSPPLGSEPGKELLEKYRAFLTCQQNILDTCFTPIMGILNDNARYPSSGLKWAAISPLMVKAGDDERGPANDLKSAHKEFLTKHRLEIKSR